MLVAPAGIVIRWPGNANRGPSIMAAKKPAAPAKTPKPAAKAATAPVVAKKETIPTVTLKQLAAGLAETHSLTKKQVETVLGDLVDAVSKRLKKGEKIRINGLGIFQVRSRPARMGRNPATGAQIKIKASKKIAFRPAKELKESV
jgi:DNA-binding protein HU-beta